MGCELVTQAEIARKTQRSRQLVHQWISGERGPGGFPPPECFITESHPLWSWCDVAGWLHQNSIVKLEVLLEAQEIERINLMLAYARMTKMEPELFDYFVNRVYGDSEPKPSARTTGPRRRSSAK